MEYRDIIGYEGLYQVSEYGYIRNIRKNKKKECKVSVNKKGYCQITLWKNNKYKTIAIHRIVATAFVKNKSEKPQVNHIDGNKQNNHFSNLEWATSSENIKHSYDVLNKKANKPWKGKKGIENPTSKPVNKLSMDGSFLHRYDNITQAAKDIGSFTTNICKTISGDHKSCKGFKFEYAE